MNGKRSSAKIRSFFMYFLTRVFYFYSFTSGLVSLRYLKYLGGLRISLVPAYTVRQDCEIMINAKKNSHSNMAMATVH